MTQTAISRGRILSSQQVRLSDAPVSLEMVTSCTPKSSRISVETDPLTGDILSISVICSCGEVTRLDCHYNDETQVRQKSR
jgi:hypothetical protein